MAERSRQKAEPPGGHQAAGFAVVGIGASAGGLEALEKFFGAVPVDSGLAFVVVQHLHPDRESHMVELLRPRTALSVVPVSDGARVQPNCVYIILPDRELTISGGALHLAKMQSPRGNRRPVDGFLASLAEDQRERAIGVILSGTGSNGSNGIRAIKAAGGLTLAQSPETAQHPGMPRSAIATGLIDVVLPPEDMPDALLRYLRHPYISGGAEAGEPPDAAAEVNRILAFLHTRAGHDFRFYRRSTLTRRIHRRMGLNNLERLADYGALLRRSADEVKALVKDLMINVTGFFRDPDAWEALKETVIAPLVRERDSEDLIRIWAPACSTGEEAYTLAILLAEQAEAAQKTFDVKIFATDTGEDNLSMARRGGFPASIERDLSEERLHRFFERTDDTVQVRRELREWVNFAPQNLLQDPPFFRVDLVTCRNFLIYLEEEAQRKVIALFHFALREGGHLFLGNAETIGRHGDLFDAVSKKWRIYRRLGPTRHDLIDFPIVRAKRDILAAGEEAPVQGPALRTAEVAQRALAERFAPAAVVVDRAHRIVYFHGCTEDYLAQPPGEPTRELFVMAREGLRSKLRAAVQSAARGGREVTLSAWVKPRDTVQPIRVTVAPLRGRSADGSLLVTFQEEAKPEALIEAAEDARAQEAREDDAHVERALVNELTNVRDELSRTIEELETTNEELKASNEEVTSMNEELQAAVEELETSKEELQSLNEELNTVNRQLQRKIEELQDTTNDLSNLLASTEIATIFLDRQLRIRFFTPAMNKLIDVLGTDLGRPISHFASKFSDDHLIRDAKAAMERLQPVEAEVAGHDGSWYVRRVMPYRTQDDRIDGVVITFVDITAPKLAQATLQSEHERITQIYDAVPQPLVVLDPDLRVRSANAAFYEAFQVQRGATEGVPLDELGNRQWDVRRLRQLLAEVLSTGRPFGGLTVEHEFDSIGCRAMLVNARRIAQQDLILFAIEDVTEHRHWEEHQQFLVAELAHRVKNTLATVQSIAAQTIRSAGSLEAFYQSFSGRLQALSQAHSLLTSGNWERAGLRDVVVQPLEPYLGGENRPGVQVEGDDLALKPRTAIALSQAVYELMTNAAKHGALSEPSGRVEVGWRLVDEDGRRALRFEWHESDGPPVETPAQTGFGMTLIERIVGYELDGSARSEFRPEGFRCEISIPYTPENFQIR